MSQSYSDFELSPFPRVVIEYVPYFNRAPIKVSVSAYPNLKRFPLSKLVLQAEPSRVRYSVVYITIIAEQLETEGG
jgi:hypothetical protein